MYNLFVTAEDGAWERNNYQYDRSRFLEYTNQNLSEALKNLNESNIDLLKSYPCLFAYEGTRSDVYIGYLTSIKERNRTVLIEFQISQDIDPIPFAQIEPIADLLDIRGWEMNRTHWAVKHEDLFVRLKNQGIPLNNVQDISKSGKPTAEKSQSPTITKLQGFIKKVLSYQYGKDREIFYRGHSSKDQYKLEPSLFRKDKEGNYLYLDVEHIICRELLVSNSADFSSDIYTLDRLVRMQHYSLPTRLLDITSNPLIALYFACKGSSEESGEVIIFAVKRENVKYFDSDVASCISNLSRLPKSEKDKIDFNLDIEDFNEQKSVRRLLHFIKEEKPFFEPIIDPKDMRKVICVKGKKSNDRITSQSGAFLLFGHEVIFDEKGTEEIEVLRITITNKTVLLKELDLLNINESTVFPYIENSARYVADKYKFNKAFKSNS
ncbi:FRG domain-containing protein [Vibrio splendidus]|uniref:FRG domain-containing protein n=1 Tax=Vibrio splendidus TaxID=29497 RepID=UPI000E08DA87|nr:FRG domain-containing protein [Vibrio splendidus]